MGHTFLFRGEPRGRADSLDWWLSLLSADAMLLSESVGGSRSLAKLSESLDTLGTERRRKGRQRYRESAVELIEKLSACESAMMAERGKTRIYPSLMHHLEKKSRYALRLARSTDAPLVCGVSAMKEISLGLALVSDTVQLCSQYLDPSERMMMRKAHEMHEVLEDKLARSLVCETGRGGYLSFLAEADEAVTEYRRLLRELGTRAEEGRLLSVFPPSFLVWADGTCAFVHRLLKRSSSGKSVLGVADEDEEVSTDEAMRTDSLMPMTILAEYSENGGAVRELMEGTAEIVPSGDEAIATERSDEVPTEMGVEAIALAEPSAQEVPAEDAPIAEEVSAEDTPLAEKEPASAEVPQPPEKIYAKASDYKNVVAKAVQKSREHTARIPRPLGKRR